MKRSLCLIVFCAVMVSPVSSEARDRSVHQKSHEKYMVLWPKERAAHQQAMDERAVAYKARGQDYVDHLYATGGETPMPDDTNMYEFEGVKEGVIKPQPVDIEQVAKIVKESTGAGTDDSTADSQ